MERALSLEWMLRIRKLFDLLSIGNELISMHATISLRRLLMRRHSCHLNPSVSDVRNLFTECDRMNIHFEQDPIRTQLSKLDGSFHTFPWRSLKCIVTSVAVLSFALRLITHFYPHLVHMRVSGFFRVLKEAILSTGGGICILKSILPSFYSQRYRKICCGTMHEHPRSSHHVFCFNTGSFILRCWDIFNVSKKTLVILYLLLKHPHYYVMDANITTVIQLTGIVRRVGLVHC